MNSLVAIDASSAGSGGAIRFLSQIGPALRKANPDITYYLLCRSALRSQLPPDLPSNFHWIQVPDATKSVFLRLLWLQTSLPGILRQIQADVLLGASDVSTFRAPCPLVLMVHNFNPFAPSRGQLWSRKQQARMAVHRWLVQRCAQKASRVLFVSQWSLQEIAPQLNVPTERCDVIYHGVDAEFNAAPGTTKNNTDAKFALIVSEVLEHKNLHRAVEAYCDLVQQSRAQLSLVIAGTVTSQTLRDSLETTLQTRGLLDHVTFTGWISTEELASLYRTAEFLLFPSLVETFGLPLIEAMASGLPVAASNASAIPEICQDSVCYFEPLDVASITQAMKSVLTDHNLRQNLVQKGLDRAAEFSWRKSGQKLFSLMEAAAASRN